MKLGETQKFASPEEALEHYGVKGMHWGIRKARETSSERTAEAVKIAEVNTTTKENLSESLRTTTTKSDISSSIAKAKEKTKNEKAADRHGLTSTQKKVLVGLGVTAGVAGFIAYKHYTKTPLIEKIDLGPLHPHDVGFGPRKQVTIGEFNKLSKAYALRNPEGLHVDLSKGYADIRPIGGIADAGAAARHAAMISSLDEMRAKYPALRDMAIEVVPMSHTPGGEVMSNATAYVQPITSGAVRLVYNTEFRESAVMQSLGSGIEKPENIGVHEIGHILAAAGNLTPSGMDARAHRTILQDIAFKQEFANEAQRRHKAMFAKHGISFDELRKLSDYAATSPEEALAELSRFSHIPENRKTLDPDLARRADALFNDLGGAK